MSMMRKASNEKLWQAGNGKDVSVSRLGEQRYV
jgi:hypothetical protein